MHASTNPFPVRKLPSLRRARCGSASLSRARFFLAVLSAILFVAALHAAPVMAQPEYVDAVNYPGNEQGWDAFYGLEQRLVRDFDEICGDTFCEGEFSNLQALRYRCSVRQADSFIGECVWTFAGSNAAIDGSTGKVLVDARTWACRTPLAPQTPIATFYSALSVARPMLATLPATATTIYEGLSNCLN